MFTYLDASSDRPSLAALMELYWRTMPAYQVLGEAVKHGWQMQQPQHHAQGGGAVSGAGQLPENPWENRWVC